MIQNVIQKKNLYLLIDKIKVKNYIDEDEMLQVCKFVASCGRTLSVHMFEEHSHGSLCTQVHIRNIY